MDRAQQATTTADVLARGREVLLGRAQQIVEQMTTPGANHSEHLQASAALLTTSLEELRVAEEELREQNTALLLQRSVEDDRLHHYREVFRQSPLAMLVTDRHATILDSNVAARAIPARSAASRAQTAQRVGRSGGARSVPETAQPHRGRRRLDALVVVDHTQR